MPLIAHSVGDESQEMPGWKRRILLNFNYGASEHDAEGESLRSEIRLGEVSLVMHKAGRSPRSRRKGTDSLDLTVSAQNCRVQRSFPICTRLFRLLV